MFLLGKLVLEVSGEDVRPCFRGRFMLVANFIKSLLAELLDTEDSEIAVCVILRGIYLFDAFQDI